MKSHDLTLDNSLWNAFTFVPESKRLLDTRYYEFDHHTKIWDIHPNVTTRGEVVIAGSISGTSCQGSSYSSGGLSWSDVIVRLKYEF